MRLCTVSFLLIFCGCLERKVSKESPSSESVNSSSITTIRPDLATSHVTALTEDAIRFDNYEQNIRREILTDPSRSSYEKFHFFGVPSLIDRLPDLPNPLRSKTVEAIFVVSGELVAWANETDASTRTIVSAVAPVCRYIAKDTRLDTDRTYSVSLSKYPLANLDLICPNEVASDVELAYAVFLQKEYKTIAAASQPSDTRVEWTLNRLGDDSDANDLRRVLDFLSSAPLERLRLGIAFPDGLVKRERFDRLVRLVILEDFMSAHFVFTEEDNRAVGKFIALCLLEMEPIGRYFYSGALEVLLGNTEPVNNTLRLLCEGFYSIIPRSRMKIFGNASRLGEILQGRPISAPRDFTIDFVEYRGLGNNLVDRQNFIPWANEAAGKRGIAIGNFGPPFSVLVTFADFDGPNVFVWPGGRLIVPRSEFQRLIR
jgi:hypothetical protein